jgi:DNA helicase-2/ATP-dependent DNA helicase PcrA
MSQAGTVIKFAEATGIPCALFCDADGQGKQDHRKLPTYAQRVWASGDEQIAGDLEQVLLEHDEQWCLRQCDDFLPNDLVGTPHERLNRCKGTLARPSEGPSSRTSQIQRRGRWASATSSRRCDRPSPAPSRRTAVADVGLSSLSAEQRAVVDRNARFILVRAGAGSGKTEVVAQRVERLLTAEGEAAFKVLALSYTRKAAGEMRARFRARLGDAGRRVQTDTLHGFAQSLLLQYGTWIGLPVEAEVVVSDADRVELFEAWRSAEGRPPLDDTRAGLLELDLCRARRESCELLADWRAALADAGALDYEGMLERATELLEVAAVRRQVARLYQHVIIDEAQNLTASQCRLLGRLIGRPGDSGGVSAMLVGDDKQSIVGFAGADAEHMARFAALYGAQEFVLTRNYRSAKRLDALARVVAADFGAVAPGHHDFAAPGQIAYAEYADQQAEGSAVARWVCELLKSGLPVEAVATGEERSVGERDIAVLARSAAALRSCSTALDDAGVQVAFASASEDWLSSDTGRLAWDIGTFRAESAISRRRLRRHGAEEAEDRAGLGSWLAASEHAALTGLADATTPAAFTAAVLDVAVDELEWVQDQQELDAVWREFCDSNAPSERSWAQFELFVSRWQRGDDAEPGVRVQSIHKSQGREFRAVAVVGLNDGQFPDFRAKRDKELEAELRTFYVAVTRPSRVLLLTRPRRTPTRYGPRYREPSPFLRFAAGLVGE